MNHLTHVALREGNKVAKFSGKAGKMGLGITEVSKDHLAHACIFVHFCT